MLPNSHDKQMLPPALAANACWYHRRARTASEFAVVLLGNRVVQPAIPPFLGGISETKRGIRA
jgi:hypothetical protein